MQCRDFVTKQCTLGTIGLILAGLGLMLAIFWCDFLILMLGKEMALKPDSRTYEPWKSPSLPLNLDIYLFNWTNPNDIKKPNSKPIMKELGPYRFREKPDKIEIVWHENNSSVSFKKTSLFHFDAEGSSGSLDDKVSTLNVVALSAAAKAKNWDGFRKSAVSVGLAAFKQQISVVKTVDELLFTGYEDDMIDMAKEVPIFGDDVEVPFDRFGWFYTRNGSADLNGHFNMITGVDSIKKIGQMHTWNYKEHSGFFDSYCGMVNGSAGEFFPPNAGDTISLFTPDMCRSLRLDSVGEAEVHGIKGIKYAGGLRSVDNGTIYPENLCFCGGECVPSGVMNISSCRFGTPVFMSYPHYFNADPFYRNQVEGIKPLQNKHEFYIILEPVSGVVLEVAARFQVNILIEEFPKIGLYSGVQKTFLPLLWFEQKVTIPAELAVEIDIIPKMVTIGHIVAGVIFSIGLVMAFWVPIDNLIRKTRGELKPQKTRKDIEQQQQRQTVKGPEISPLIEKRNVLDKGIQLVPTTKQDSSDIRDKTIKT